MAAKQAFETTQVKKVFHGPQGQADFEKAVAETEAERAPLAQALSNARVPVIHTIRDGRDAAVSWALHRAGMDRVLPNPEQEDTNRNGVGDACEPVCDPPGDANHDGCFGTGDLVKVLQAGKYETKEPANCEEGDWNGDGIFDTGDLVYVLQLGHYEKC